MEFDTPVKEIKGIGPKTEPYYHKLGLYAAKDILYYFPRDYMHYDKPETLSDDKVSSVCFFYAQVVTQPLLRRGAKFQIVSATLLSGEQKVTAVWFHMPYLTKSLKAGKKYVFRGLIERQGDHLHVEQPQIYTEEAYLQLENTLQPIYSLTKGLSNQALIKCVHQVLDNLPLSGEGTMIEPFYDGDLSKESITKREALLNIHFPQDYDNLLRARKRLVFDEFFIFILRLRRLREDNIRTANPFNIFPSALCQRLIESLPYRLTDAQLKVWGEIENDLTGDKVMNRLIQGDVGSGKTIIAILSCVCVAMSGYQCAVMAPTEILATQHFESLCTLFNKLNIPIKCVLLTGSMTAVNKRRIYEEIKSGEASIIIGTHALIQEKVEYSSLALVVCDEQHRFGVKQRETLKNKGMGKDVHTLVMSATPIPRTLAIIMYGDLDISIIDEVPKRRLPIKNCVVNTDYRLRAYSFMEKEIDKNHQVYVICPLVEESDGLDCENVIDYADKLREHFAGREDIHIAYLHGKMKPSEKNNVMDAFYKNDIQILVSTTVVEVGVNVPNATVMLIENAERFGLAGLHQLRGRIGRGDAQSYCIFMSSKSDKKTMERLDILNKSNDGFKIASEDLKQRGPGDLFGIRQSGDALFALGDVFNDADMLKAASEAVQKLLKEDPDLNAPCHLELKRYLDESMDVVYSI